MVITAQNVTTEQSVQILFPFYTHKYSIKRFKKSNYNTVFLHVKGCYPDSFSLKVYV